MKRVLLWSSLIITIIAGVSLYMAMQTGVTSPVFAAGTIRLNDELEPQARGIRTLFITVFDADSPMPMPYGAMRERLSADAQGQFHQFFITKERLQVMRPHLDPPKNLRIKVRLDRDGAGGADQPGDLTGEVRGIAFGSRDLALTINKKIGG